METTELAELDERKLCHATNYSDQTKKFYGRKSDESAQAALIRIYGCEMGKEELQ